MPISIRVAVVLIREGRILLVNHRRRGRSYWVLPGGEVRHGETLEECAKRELWEEAGLRISIIRLLYVSDCIPPRGDKHILDVFFLGQVEAGELTVKPGLPAPLERPEFIDLDALPSLPLYPPIAFEILDDLKSGFEAGGRYLDNTWCEMA